MLRGGQELQHPVIVVEVPDHRLVVGRDRAQGRRERGRLGPPLVGRKGAVALEGRAERLGLGVLGEVGLGLLDDPQRVLLRLLRRCAPGGDAVAAEDAAPRLRVFGLDRGDVQAQLESGPPPGHPDDLVAEDLLGQRLAVRRRGDGDAGVRVQVIDVRRIDQTVHRRVDRRRRPALAVQAVVERRHHLVLAVHAGVDVDQRAHPVEPQYRQPRLGQRAEVTAGAFDPHELDGLAGHRVGFGALGGGVATRVVGVLRIRAEPVGPGDEIGYCLVGHHFLWFVHCKCSGSTFLLELQLEQERGTRAAVGLGPSFPRRPSLLVCRRRGRFRSASGSRTRRRRASGRRAARGTLATRSDPGVRRCRRHP